MTFSPREYRAIGWYADTNSLRPQLSARPVMYFLDAKGAEVQEHLTTVLDQYDNHLEKRKRERAQERRIEAKLRKLNPN